MAKSFSKAETDTPVLESPQAIEKCANRGCSNPLDRQGRPKWCKECWAAYQREYRVLAMQEDKQIPGAVDLERFRGDRLQGLTWPKRLERDPDWLWRAVF